VTDREPVDVARVVKDWLKADLATRFPTLSVALELPPLDAGVQPGPGGRRRRRPDGGVAGGDVADDPRHVVDVGPQPHLRARRAGPAADGPIPGIAAILPGTGSSRPATPKTRGDLASFTVRARARTAVPQ
jgi:hypothetical protein